MPVCEPRLLLCRWSTRVVTRIVRSGTKPKIELIVDDGFGNEAGCLRGCPTKQVSLQENFAWIVRRCWCQGTAKSRSCPFVCGRELVQLSLHLPPTLLQQASS